MPSSIGTRNQQTLNTERTDQGSETRSHSADKGMTKLFTGSMTFTASNGRVTASNGDLAAFAVNDPVFVQGIVTNNGNHFVVTGIDAANGAYLVLDPPPKNEGPVSGTIRTE